ncbi:hypothetical protein [Nostoc sphaeroides]|nr:hypothetical protein [Nostoc sphaeroides]
MKIINHKDAIYRVFWLNRTVLPNPQLVCIRFAWRGTCEAL